MGFSQGQGRRRRIFVSALKGWVAVFPLKKYLPLSNVIQYTEQSEVIPLSCLPFLTNQFPCPVDCCLKLCLTFVPSFFIPKHPHPQPVRIALKTLFIMNEFLYYINYICSLQILQKNQVSKSKREEKNYYIEFHHFGIITVNILVYTPPYMYVWMWNHTAIVSCNLLHIINIC